MTNSHDQLMPCLGCDDLRCNDCFESKCRELGYTRPTAVASHAEGEALVTSCCGRSECGGECGNEWSGIVNPGDNQMPFMSDDDVERLSLQAGWEGNRKYMTKADFHIWCDRMRAFAALAHPPRSGDEALKVPDGYLLVRDPIHWGQEENKAWHRAIPSVRNAFIALANVTPKPAAMAARGADK